MSRKKMAAGVACAVLAAAFAAVMALWQPWGGGEGGSSSGDGAGGGASPAEDGYVGPTGRGTVSRDDYATDEEYIDALMAERNEGGAPREYEVVELSDGTSYYKGLVYVDFYRSCGEKRAREIVAEVGGEWRDDTFAWDTGIDTASVKVYFPGDADEEALAEKLESYPEVQAANRSLRIPMEQVLDMSTNDPRLPEQGYLPESGFPEAWDAARCEHAARVAVLDTGIDFDHEDLDPNIMDALGYDASTGGMLPVFGSELGQGHGTMVAGVACAKADNGIGIAGASFDADVIPVRVFDSEGGYDWSYLVDALEYLGALPDWQLPAAVNMSFSEGEFSLDASGRRDRIEDLISELRGRGVVFVAASGNLKADEDAEELRNRRFPAAFPGVLAVGNLGPAGVIDPDSKRYAEVDLCAPGTDVLTTSDPDIRRTRYYTPSGTSFSAPQVAAAAALVRAAHPGWGADEVERALVETARKLPAMGGSNHTDEYGYGALDAAAAVAWTPPSTGGGSGSPALGGSILDAYRASGAGR